MEVSGLIPDVVRANIESRMARLGRTQAEVSRLGEMAQGEFSKIVGQKRGANLRNLERIAKGLSTNDEQCTVTDLFRTEALFEDPALRNPAQLRSWLNQWGREQANRLFRQVEPLVLQAGQRDGQHPRLLVHYATDDEIEALRDQGVVRGDVAAGFPIFATEDMPIDWVYRAREYVTFSDEQTPDLPEG